MRKPRPSATRLLDDDFIQAVAIRCHEQRLMSPHRALITLALSDVELLVGETNTAWAHAAGAAVLERMVKQIVQMNTLPPVVAFNLKQALQRANEAFLAAMDEIEERDDEAAEQAAAIIRMKSASRAQRKAWDTRRRRGSNGGDEEVAAGGEEPVRVGEAVDSYGGVRSAADADGSHQPETPSGGVPVTALPRWIGAGAAIDIETGGMGLSTGASVLPANGGDAVVEAADVEAAGD